MLRPEQLRRHGSADAIRVLDDLAAEIEQFAKAPDANRLAHIVGLWARGNRILCGGAAA